MTQDPPREESPDLSELIQQNQDPVTEEQKQFNDLSTDDKLNRLNNLVKKSQIYSQIILDNILENTLNKKKNQQPAEPPKKKQKKGSKKKNKTPKNDVLSMLSNNVSDSTTKTKSIIESAQTSHTQKQPKLLSGGTLKDYQLDGLEWLTTLYENGLNGILADDMGVGKTIQCISLLCFLMENQIKGPFLIVAPLSTVSNWCNEFKKFAPKVNVFKYIGDKNQRKKINISKVCQSNNVIITSYELSIKDFNKFNKINDWKFLIVDEGHRLKNYECLLMKILKRLNTSNRLLLTGTPLQNNLGELWSLLNFILPDIFHDLELFEQWFNFNELTNLSNQISGDNNDKNLLDLKIQENLITSLHTILKPFILRRLKKDVIKDLPPKKEYLIHIPLSNLQKKIYKNALNNNLVQTLVEVYLKEFIIYNHHDLFPDTKVIEEFLQNKFKSTDDKNSIKRERNLKYNSLKDAEENDEFEVEVIEIDDTPDAPLTLKEQQLSLLNSLYDKIFKEVKLLPLRNVVMQLRNICSSPYIYYEPFIPNEITKEKEGIFMKILFENSSKLKILNQLLKNLLPFNHKVLIFSQFTKMLDLLHDWLDYQKIEVCRLDGSTMQEDRDDAIKSFNDLKDNKQVFLLSTRAGGLGINLIAADTVILLDNDWNPQVDLQAIDRVHRIGQLNPVKIYRFLVRNSIEEILISKSYSKRFLEKLIIQMGEFKFNNFIERSENNDPNDTNTISELISLSKKFISESDDKNESSIQDFNYIFDDDINTEKSIPDNYLTDDEILELTSRDESIYQNNQNQNFPNITVFETVNNMEK